MRSDLPIEVVSPVFEVSQDRDRNAQFPELLLGDRVEAGILEGAGYGVLPETRLQVHRVERTDASPQSLVFPYFPRNEQWTVRENC